MNGVRFRLLFFFCSASYSDILWLLIPPRTLYCWGSRWQPLSALVFCLPSLVAGSLPLCIPLKFAEFFWICLQSGQWCPSSLWVFWTAEDLGSHPFVSRILSLLFSFLLLGSGPPVKGDLCSSVLVALSVLSLVNIYCGLLLVSVTTDNNEMFCVGAFQIKVLVVQSTSTTTTKL